MEQDAKVIDCSERGQVDKFPKAGPSISFKQCMPPGPLDDPKILGDNSYFLKVDGSWH